MSSGTEASGRAGSKPCGLSAMGAAEVGIPGLVCACRSFQSHEGDKQTQLKHNTTWNAIKGNTQVMASTGWKEGTIHSDARVPGSLQRTGGIGRGP